ncbi:hypothetical protein [Zooshikella harenae]|uniref:Uncharacterized protein n=1 Tax=Zooshikella harenae TaxID=2827238 RepID=A0ABS5ZFQ4_9GAMM|nr:hypothetical protein [Zooshikella harenae]MBU2712896.1 hypothetical protein [Zooshikella harenae]
MTTKKSLIFGTIISLSLISAATSNASSYNDSDSCKQSGKGYSSCTTHAGINFKNNKTKTSNNNDWSFPSNFPTNFPSNNDWSFPDFPDFPDFPNFPNDNNWPNTDDTNSNICQDIAKVDQLKDWKTTGTAKLTGPIQSSMCEGKNEFHLSGSSLQNGELIYPLTSGKQYSLDIIVHGLNNIATKLYVNACGSQSTLSVKGDGKQHKSTGRVKLNSIYANCDAIRIYTDYSENPNYTIAIDKLEVTNN